jgi:hypothetical protein
VPEDEDSRHGDEKTLSNSRDIRPKERKRFTINHTAGAGGEKYPGE